MVRMVVALRGRGARPDGRARHQRDVDRWIAVPEKVRR
jgi:hypothetical protein